MSPPDPLMRAAEFCFTERVERDELVPLRMQFVDIARREITTGSKRYSER